MYSQSASSSTNALLSERSAATPTPSRLFTVGNRSSLMRRSIIVTLAGAAVADRDHVFSTSNVLAERQLKHQCLVEREERRDADSVEAFHGREPLLLDAALDHRDSCRCRCCRPRSRSLDEQ